MVCLGFKPGAAGWKAQMNPLSYSGTPNSIFYYIYFQSTFAFKQETEKLKNNF